MTARFGFAGLVLAVAACSDATSTSGTPPVDAGSDAAEPKPSTLPQTCARGVKKTERPATCNGDASLCARTYDQVVVPMTHNAMNDSDEEWGVPNQTHSLGRQLEDGIRGMMLDLHYYASETNQNADAHDPTTSTVDQVYLCHASCLLGKTRLLDGLCTVTKFLDDHPGEIVSIIFETYVSDSDTDEVLRASGIADYAYSHTPGTPWPTLGAILDSGKRAVLFVEKGGGVPSYLHPAYQGEIWDTPYDFQKVTDFNCNLGRGIAGSPLFLVNHWLGTPLPDIAYGRQVNVEAVLGARVAQCTKEAGRAPTFVSVDFYDVGDLFGVVRKANGLGP